MSARSAGSAVVTTSVSSAVMKTPSDVTISVQVWRCEVMPLRRARGWRIDKAGASPLELRTLDGVLAERDRVLGGGGGVAAAAQEVGVRGVQRGVLVEL